MNLLKLINMNLSDIQQEIDIVTNDILSRFPVCSQEQSHTVTILLWDDGTRSVECRHGNDDGSIIYVSTFYKGELSHEIHYVDGMVMTKDKFGKYVMKYLTDTK